MPHFRYSREEIDDRFLENKIEVLIEHGESEMNLSGLLAGFSLGGVVALLFVERSPLVVAMIVSGLIASWAFTVATLNRSGVVETARAIKQHRHRYGEVAEAYEAIRFVDVNQNAGSNVFLIGLLAFLSVLGCAAFLISLAVGGGVLVAGFGLIYLGFSRIGSLTHESAYFEWVPWDQIPTAADLEAAESKSPAA